MLLFLNPFCYLNIHCYSTALDMHIAVAVLRVQEGLDFTGIIQDYDEKIMDDKNDADPKDEEVYGNPAFVYDEDSVSIIECQFLGTLVKKLQF